MNFFTSFLPSSSFLFSTTLTFSAIEITNCSLQEGCLEFKEGSCSPTVRQPWNLGAYGHQWHKWSESKWRLSYATNHQISKWRRVAKREDREDWEFKSLKGLKAQRILSGAKSVEVCSITLGQPNRSFFCVFAFCLSPKKRSVLGKRLW